MDTNSGISMRYNENHGVYEVTDTNDFTFRGQNFTNVVDFLFRECQQRKVRFLDDDNNTTISVSDILFYSHSVGDITLTLRSLLRKTSMTIVLSDFETAKKLKDHIESLYLIHLLETE